MFSSNRRNPAYASVRYTRRMVRYRALSMLAAFLVVAGSAGVLLAGASEGDDQVAQIDAEFAQTERLLKAHRDEQLEILDLNHDEEIAALQAAHAARVTEIEATRDRDRSDLEAAHSANRSAIEAEYADAIAAIEASHAEQRAAVDALYAELVAELSPEGMTQDDLEDAYKAAKSDVEDARDLELAALKAALASDRSTAAAAFDALEARLESRLADLKISFETTKRALEDEERALLDAHDDRTDAMLAPHEAEQQYWEAEKKAIENAVDAVYKPQLAAIKAKMDELKAKGKEDTPKYAELEADYKALDAERKFERLDQTVVERAMIEEMKAIIADIKATQGTIEQGIKAGFDLEIRTLESEYRADRDVVEQRLDVAESAYKALDSDLKSRFEVDKRLIEDSYEVLLDQLKEQYEQFADSARDHESRLDEWRHDALERAKRARDEAVATENSDYEQTRKGIDATREAALRSENRSFDLAEDDADERHEQGVDRVERGYRRNLDMAASEHFILRERVRAFLASDQLVPLGEFFDPKADPGSLYNVTRRIKADHDSYTGAGVQVALIDTGIVDVEGLRTSNVTIGPDFSFEDIDPELRARDTNGHGTHLAGIIVGSDRAWVDGDHQRRPERALGVAPSAELVAIKVGAADGAVDVTQVIAAIDWVIAANASGEFDIRVINLAFGTNGTQAATVDPLSFAVERAWRSGIVVVVAAGNDGLDASRLTNPATNPFVIAVGAGQARGDELVLSGFSNGSDGRGVDVVAPGRSIASFRNPGSFADTHADAELQDESLVRGSGTSQAAAVVTGVVALMLEERPGLTPDQVKWLLMDSAKSTNDPAAGAGFVQADKAIDQGLPGDQAEWVQTHEPANGSGSIDASRGDVRVSIDGVVLEGEIDIFGNSWTGNSWTGNSWTGNSWTGNSWTGNSWTGNSWTGNSWTGNSWTGNSWTGNSWTGNSWTGNSWTGNSWTGNSWTGNSWTSIVWGS